MLGRFCFAGSIAAIAWSVVVSTGVRPALLSGLPPIVVVVIGFLLGVSGILGVMSELKDLQKKIDERRK
mgnify:CR=1 FL=1